MEVDEESVGTFDILDFDHCAFASEVHGVEVVDNNHVSDAHVVPKPKQEAADSVMSAEDADAGVSEDAGQSDEENDELEERAPLSYELQQGFRILRELMADSNKTVNWPFLDRVDDTYPETADYYERIKRPMWLTKMEEKFDQREYTTITEFVADFRLMLENCYRFNGPDHHISKKGQRLETMLEQKLALLSRELRAKTTVAATSGRKEEDDFVSGLRRRPKTYVPHDSTALLNQLRNEEAQREREQRRQQIADRRAANEAAQKEILDWESNTLLAHPIKSHMLHSWELPQIGLFLYLLREPLNLWEIPQFELERCLAMSRQSSTLHLIMTSLLSTPFQRQRLDKKKVMPYSVWTFKLTKKLDVWYKALSDCGGDKNAAATKLGLEAKSFDIMGTKNPLRRRPFHKHTFYRKVWIVKSLCEYCLETQESLRKYLEDFQPLEDQRELVLGNDAKGNIYIHFPQFCGADLRIYRQRKPQYPESSEDEEEEDTSSEQSQVSSAKRQLKLGNQSSKNGRSVTPTKDSESEGVPSPAPSSIKSRSQSRTSSPMLKENPGRQRQTSARNTPSPHNPSQDNLLGAAFSGSKTRRTRNSAEASLLFSMIDIEALERRGRSKKSKAAPAAETENVDSESCCSNVGEESSQDGMPSVCDSKTSLEADGANTSKQNDVDARGSGPDKAGCGTPVMTEFDSIYSKSSPISDKLMEAEGLCDKSVDSVKLDKSSTSHSSSLVNSHSAEHIKDERDSDQDDDVIKNLKKEVQSGGEVEDLKTESASCDECSSSSVPQYSASHHANDNSSLDSKPLCDLANEIKPIIDNSKTDCENQQHDSKNSNKDPACDTKQSLSDVCDKKQYKENDNSTRQSDCDTKDFKADDSGFMSTGCVGGSPKDSDEDVGSDKGESVREVRTSVEAALIDHAAYSVTASSEKPSKSRVKEEIIMEESDEEEEEMEPDLEEFELIVDSVKGLHELVAQFADTPPPPPDTTNSRKSKKQRAWKPPVRKKCEVELHQRLSSMLNELSKWESKLVAAASRMRTKMKREFDDFAEESPKEEDSEDWDTEPEAESSDEEGNEDSQTGEDAEDSEVSQSGALLVAEKKKKGPSSTPSITSETAENDQRDTEDYELDVSSRGRLRKRRVIPNNIEDQGLKKKKILKKSEAEGTPVTTAAHVPNILQKSQAGKQLTYTFSPSGLGDSSALLASLSRQGGGVVSLSASQLLAMAVSQGPHTAGKVTVTGNSKSQQQQHGLILTSQGLQILRTSQAASQASASTAATTTVSSKLSAHPEIQKLLSARRPLVVDSRHAPYKTVQLATTASASTEKTSAAQVSVTSTSVATSVVSGTQQAAGSGQTVSPGAGSGSTGQRGSLVLAMIGGKPQLLPASAIQQLMRTGNFSIKTTTLNAAPNTTSASVSQTATTQPGTSIVGASARTQGSIQIRPAAAVQVVRPAGAAVQSSDRMQLNPLVLKATGQGQATNIAQGRLQGIAGVMGGAGGAVISGTTVGNQIVIASSSMAQIAGLGSPSKQLQRYAGNVTVKTLLENRALRKSSEDGDASQSSETLGQSSAPNTPPKAVTVALTVAVTTSPTPSVATGTVALTPGTVLMPKGVSTPGVVKLTSQAMLDLAVQTVVTSYHTTLPTADIKVPSPTTLPSLSPKKNVTSVVMSTKAPIPITTRCQSTTSASIVTRTAGMSSVPGMASGAGASSLLTAVAQGSNPGKPGMVLMTGGRELESGSNKILLQVVPQGNVQQQGFVQGVMLADGTVIPQGALSQAVQLQTAVRAVQQTQQTLVAGSSKQGSGDAPEMALAPGTDSYEPSSRAHENHSVSLSQKAQTAVLSSSLTDSAQGGTGQATGSKLTTDVLKSMLADKISSTTTPQQQTSSSAVSSAAIVSPTNQDQRAALAVSGGVKIGASTPAAALVQQIAAAGSSQSPRIIAPQVARVQVPVGSQIQVSTGQVLAGQVQGVQQQGNMTGKIILGATPQGGQVMNAGVQGAQQASTEKVMTMSLPPGFQLAQVPGSTALQLVAPAQLASGAAGGTHPLVAALQGAQGLQQVRLVATPRGAQKVHVLTPQQQQALAVKQLTAAAALGGQGKVGGQVMPGQSALVPGANGAGSQLQAVIQGQQPQVQPQQVQLCFKVQPRGQVVASNTTALTSFAQSVATQVAGVRPVLPRPQANQLRPQTVTTLIPSTSLTSGRQGPLEQMAQKIILSPRPLTSPNTQFAFSSPSSTVTVDLNSPLTSTIANSSLSVQPSASTPEKVETQNSVQVTAGAAFPNTVLPVSKTVLGSGAPATRLQMTITPDPSTGQLTVSPQAAVPVAQNTVDSGNGVRAKTVTVGQKRTNSASPPQAVPAKVARMHAPGNLAGPVLANLSQVVGAKMNKTSGIVSSILTGSSPKPPSTISNYSSIGQQLTSGQQLDQSIRTTEAVVRNPESSSLVDTANTVNPSQPAQAVQAQISVAQLLQRMQQSSASSANSTGVHPQVQTQGREQQILLQQLQQGQTQQQQPMVMMRTVGGQLLTPLNIPVTVNNGVVKVLPKATIQVGNQMVTVLSPSNAMIQNLKSPTQNLATGVTAAENSLNPQPSQAESQEPMHSLNSTHQLASSSYDTENAQNALVTSSNRTTASSVSDGLTTVLDGSNMPSVCPATDTPILKARLQQPVNTVSNPHSSVMNGASGEQMNTAADSITSQQSVVSESGDGTAPNGDGAASTVAGGVEASAGASKDSLIDKEQAALSLLTFANQAPME